MSKKLIMIDGNSLVFRAFHALPPMKMSNGQVINAAYGFFNMLLGLIDEHHPDYLAVSFDLKGPTFRKEMFDAYKAKVFAPTVLLYDLMSNSGKAAQHCGLVHDLCLESDH